MRPIIQSESIEVLELEDLPKMGDPLNPLIECPNLKHLHLKYFGAKIVQRLLQKSNSKSKQWSLQTLILEDIKFLTQLDLSSYKELEVFKLVKKV